MSTGSNAQGTRTLQTSNGSGIFPLITHSLPQLALLASRAHIRPEDVSGRLKGSTGVQGTGGLDTLALATASVDRTARLFSGTGMCAVQMHAKCACMKEMGTCRERCAREMCACTCERDVQRDVRMHV